MGSTSSSLLSRLRGNDQASWRRLIELYSPVVYTWCRRCGLGTEDSADVMQDVFRQIAASIRVFRRERSGDTFRGWLRTVARNKIRDHFRRKSGCPSATGGTDAAIRLQSVPAQEPDLSDSNLDNGDLFYRALALVRHDFEPHTWQAFWLTTVDGQAANDVALQLGMTHGSVRQAKYKVLRRLREELGETQ